MYESLLDGLARADRAGGRAGDDQVPGRPHLRCLARHGQELPPPIADLRLPRRQADPGAAARDLPGPARRPRRRAARPARRHPGRARRRLEGDAACGRERGHDVACHQARALDAKKKTLGADERDEVARQTWRDDVAPTLDPRRIVSVDEMAATIALTRLYGYAPHDERCRGSAPRNYDLATNLVAAL